MAQVVAVNGDHVAYDSHDSHVGEINGSKVNMGFNESFAKKKLVCMIMLSLLILFVIVKVLINSFCP